MPLANTKPHAMVCGSAPMAAAHSVRQHDAVLIERPAARPAMVVVPDPGAVPSGAAAVPAAVAAGPTKSAARVVDAVLLRRIAFPDATPAVPRLPSRVVSAPATRPVRDVATAAPRPVRAPTRAAGPAAVSRAPRAATTSSAALPAPSAVLGLVGPSEPCSFSAMSQIINRRVCSVV